MHTDAAEWLDESMSAALRRDVRMLGDTLSVIIGEAGGTDLVRIVETARRRVVTESLHRIGEQLERLDGAHLSRTAAADIRRRLHEEIAILWRTAHVRDRHALQRVRGGGQDADRWRRLVNLTVSGVSAGLQNTG